MNQQNLVQDIRDYLGTTSPQMGKGETVHSGRKRSDTSALFGGPILCLCVVTMWLLYIFGEVRTAGGLLLAFYRLPRSRSTTLQMTPDLDIKIVSVTSCRFACVVLLTMARLAIAGFLGVA